MCGRRCYASSIDLAVSRAAIYNTDIRAVGCSPLSGVCVQHVDRILKIAS